MSDTQTITATQNMKAIPVVVSADTIYIDSKGDVHLIEKGTELSVFVPSGKITLTNT